MSTLQKVVTTIQSLAVEVVPPKLRPRFLTGCLALGITEFQSLSANGRRLTAAPKTGQRRVERLVADGRFPLLIQTIICTYFLAGTGSLHLSLDHSQFGPFYIAVLALSVGKGRSLPVWCQVGRRDRALMRPLIAALRRLFATFDHTDRHRLLFTMDRWFASPRLLPFLDAAGVRFICRVKYSLPVMVPWDCFHTVEAGEVSHEETDCEYAGLELRLVRSSLRAGMKEDEPWFLLTNDQTLTRRQVLRTYAKRFEIEEMFKDVKWIQAYEWSQIRTPAVIATVLGFAFLGWWLLFRCCQPVIRAMRKRTVHPHQRLSWFRACWEAIQREIHQAVFVPLLTGS